jgi:pimeloyl-ACP methyl ester carboxylesterase
MPEGQSKSAQSNNLKIDFADAGKGEPTLLLMPGWCATRAAFGKLPELCAHHRRTLALDWRGHGRSAPATADFGEAGLVEDALAVIQASGASAVIPVALSHSGWVAIELRRRLGERVPKLVLLDWIVLDPPASFLPALHGLQDREHWQEARGRLFTQWLQGVGNEAVTQFVQLVMGSFEYDMWSRAGREISRAYERYGNPLRALEELSPRPDVLHLYAQPSDPVYWQAQQTFAESHGWFRAERVNAFSHFPMLEEPQDMANAIEKFVVGTS